MSGDQNCLTVGEAEMKFVTLVVLTESVLNFLGLEEVPRAKDLANVIENLV